ncbi:MAG: carbohydrate kinase family protein [Anaerolineales bacterium]|nr:carbohydrate kinase family protein [Anaerolineales bacterium]
MSQIQNQTAPEVVCAGILVADIFAPPLPRLPQEGELLKVDDFLMTVGGCAANTGADLARLGVRAAVMGKVGEDIFGDFVINDLAHKGLDAAHIRRSETYGTSRTVILPVIGQDRRYIHTVGANADFTPADLDLDTVMAARVFYVGGYLLAPALTAAALAEIFQLAQQRGVQTVLDVAGVGASSDLEALRPILPHTDVFLPNDDEALLLTGERDPLRQAQIFLDLGARVAGITLGAQGAIVRTAQDTVRAGVYPVDVVDPSGSGDAFDAGFIVGMLEGWSLARTVAFAAAAGACACTALGCTAGVRTRAETEAFIRNHASILTAPDA